MSDAPVDRKCEWSERVFEQLRAKDLLTTGHRLVSHAGRDHTDELVPVLAETPVEIERQTDGLRFGETLSWYNERF